MKKLITVLSFVALLGIGASHAAGIVFQKDKSWAQLLARAKRANKLIFLDAYASWCGPCKYLQNNIFTDPSVGNYFNLHFINAKMDMEMGEGPALARRYKVTAYPTLFFINGDGKVVHKAVGSMEVAELIKVAKNALNPATQFYTLNKRAAAGTLKPAQFLIWAKEAKQAGDEDVAEIVKNYISLPANQQWDKDMLDIIIYYANTLNEEQLGRLKTQAKEVGSIEGLNEADFAEIFNDKVVSYAISKSYNDNLLNFDIFKSTVDKFEPQRSVLETQKIKVRFYSYSKQYDKALDALLLCLDTTNYRVGPAGMFDLIKDNAKIIAASTRTEEFAGRINGYPLLPSEVKLDYYPPLSLLVLYQEANNGMKAREMATKIENNPNAPQSLKDEVKSFITN